MDASYRFFQNRACEFFPCHAVEDVEKFNCLFAIVRYICGRNVLEIRLIWLTGEDVRSRTVVIVR